MSAPYVLTVLVTSGDPDGVRVVEKSNWTGQGIVFGRSDLPAALEQDLKRPGVYVLIGEDPDGGFDRQIYVGQGEDLGNRLKQHLGADAKEFWTDTIVFVAKDGALNRADILYLESRLVDLAHDAKRARLANGTRPPLPAMSAVDLAKADGFLTEMLPIFPLLSLQAFEKPVASASGGLRRYFLSGPGAKGEGEDRLDGFLVFAGATARIAEVASMQPAFSKTRAQLVTNGTLMVDGDVYRLTSDHLFSSPSTAAIGLLARTANGRIEWKDLDGVTLKDRQAEAIGEAT